MIKGAGSAKFSFMRPGPDFQSRNWVFYILHFFWKLTPDFFFMLESGLDFIHCVQWPKFPGPGSSLYKSWNFGSYSTQPICKLLLACPMHMSDFSSPITSPFLSGILFIYFHKNFSDICLVKSQKNWFDLINYRDLFLKSCFFFLAEI